MAKSKSMCSGCYQDFYNHNRPDGCWMFEKAKIVKRVQVGTWEPPPYDRKRAKSVLSCYSPQGYAMLKTDDQRVQVVKSTD